MPKSKTLVHHNPFTSDLEGQRLLETPQPDNNRNKTVKEIDLAERMIKLDLINMGFAHSMVDALFEKELIEDSN